MGGQVSGREAHRLTVRCSGTTLTNATLVVEQPADDPTEQPATALPLGVAAGALLHGRMEVRALKPDSPRSGEAVEHEIAGAAHDARLEPVDLLSHLHRVVAEDPAPRLDVDRLPRLKILLEHVAVAVDPNHALVVASQEVVDPEAAAVHHVREALLAAVVVLDAARGGQELVLADHDALPGLEVERDNVTRRIAAERDLAGRLDLQHQERHPAEYAALEALAQGMQADLELRVFPQQYVVLEVDRHLAVERHVQDRDELAF